MLYTIKGRLSKWIGQILRNKRLLIQVTEYAEE
jgi:hypothetical protein